MHRSRVAAGLACLVSACTLALAAEAASVPMQVDETLGVQRRSWPVTIGVPLPKGWSSSDAVRVVDGKSGKPVPTQSRILARWPKGGGARWVLVDFQTDLEARQKRPLTLQAGAPPAPKTKVAATQKGADVEVDTGVMRLLVGRGSGGLFRLQSLRGKPVQSDPVRVEMAAGGRAAAAGAPPDKISIEENGPLRAVVKLRGRYAGGFDYEVRLQAFAGQPTVQVQHTFIDGSGDKSTSLERLSVHVPAPGKGENSYTAQLTSGQKLEGKVAAKGVSLVQVDSATLRHDGQAKTGRLDGWFELRGTDFSLGLDAPFFWQEFPQAVHLSPHALVYDLWADAGEGPAAIGVGAAKTHEFFISFAKGADIVAEPGRGITAFTDPTWTAQSGALLNAVDPAREPKFIGAAEAAFERTEKSIDAEVWDQAGACEEPQKAIRRVGAYGMLNWGDWNYRGYHDTTKGCDAWGNQEYDLTQVLGLLFAATGDTPVRRFFTAAARHYTDVDIIHHQPERPEWVGMNHPKNPWHFSFAYGGVDLGHTWVEGLFTYHFLTGDERAWEGALGISDYLLRREPKALRGNPRQFGWPAIALAAAYEATGADKYKSAAVAYALKGIDKHPVPETLGKDWKIGILADAVSYAHAISGEPKLRGWLESYAKTVLRSDVKDVRYFPAVAYVGRLTNNAAMLEAARATAARLAFGDWAKPFTIDGRTGFRILSQTDAAH